MDSNTAETLEDITRRVAQQMMLEDEEVLIPEGGVIITAQDELIQYLTKAQKIAIFQSIKRQYNRERAAANYAKNPEKFRAKKVQAYAKTAEAQVRAESGKKPVGRPRLPSII